MFADLEECSRDVFQINDALQEMRGYNNEQDPSQEVDFEDSDVCL